MQTARFVSLRARQHLHRLACLRSLQLWPAAIRRGFQDDHPPAAVGFGGIHEQNGKPAAVMTAAAGGGAILPAFSAYTSSKSSCSPSTYSPAPQKVAALSAPKPVTALPSASASQSPSPQTPTKSAQLPETHNPRPLQICSASVAATEVAKQIQIQPKYELQTGISLFAKRPSPPFPPPFDCAPSPSSAAQNSPGESRDGFRDFHFDRVRKTGDADLGGAGIPTGNIGLSSLELQNAATSGSGDVSVERAATTAPAAAEEEVVVVSEPLAADSLGDLRGFSNGDDAVVAAPWYLGVADGVGAWNTRAQGNAALWSRLILHFWAMQIEDDMETTGMLRSTLDKRSTSSPLAEKQQHFTSMEISSSSSPSQLLPREGKKEKKEPKEEEKEFNPLEALQKSYDTVTLLTNSFPSPFLGTTTACMAILLPTTNELLLANVGDSQAFVFRPSVGKFVARTEEQWHWFDCPRQLGTNSPDTPLGVGVVTRTEVEEGDVVVVATDGLMDNLWEGEVVAEIEACIKEDEEEGGKGDGGLSQRIADRLVERAKAVAGDPWGLSPYMERAVEQGMGVEGGKWDDISVCVGRCLVRKGGDGKMEMQ